MFVIGSSYVSSLRSHVICIALSYLFVREMSDLLLRTSSHCPFHYYIHYWCDFTSCLIWVDHHISSYIHCFVVIFVIACDSSHSLHPPCSFLTLTYSRFDVSFSSFLPISLSVRFASLSYYWHHIRVRYPQVHGSRDLLYMLHFIYEGGHEFLIIGYLSLIFLHFYYPITLAYVTSRVLRPPWGHEIRCCLRQPLLGQVFEIWLIFRYRHVFSSRSHLFDV